jgi:hypothetical protein
MPLLTNFIPLTVQRPTIETSTPTAFLQHDSPTKQTPTTTLKSLHHPPQRYEHERRFSSNFRARVQLVANPPSSPWLSIAARPLANKHRSLLCLSSSEMQSTNTSFPTGGFTATGLSANLEGLQIAVQSDSTRSPAAQPSFVQTGRSTTKSSACSMVQPNLVLM